MAATRMAGASNQTGRGIDLAFLRTVDRGFDVVGRRTDSDVPSDIGFGSSAPGILIPAARCCRWLLRVHFGVVTAALPAARVASAVAGRPFACVPGQGSPQWACPHHLRAPAGVAVDGQAAWGRRWDKTGLDITAQEGSG